MFKIYKFVCIALITFIVVLHADVKTNKYQHRFDNITEVFSADFPSFGKLQRNELNEITHIIGYNYLLGYSEKYFFSPLKFEEWISYWTWGTVLFVLPYFGIGMHYTNKKGMFYNFNLTYIIPSFSMGVYF